MEPKGGVNEKIPLNTSARTRLETHPRVQYSPYIFPSKDGGLRHRNSLARPLRRIRERARLPEDFRPLHGFRYVHAYMLASSRGGHVHPPEVAHPQESAHDPAVYPSAGRCGDAFASGSATSGFTSTPVKTKRTAVNCT